MIYFKLWKMIACLNEMFINFVLEMQIILIIMVEIGL